MKPQTFDEWATEQGFDVSKESSEVATQYVNDVTMWMHMAWKEAHENAALVCVDETMVYSDLEWAVRNDRAEAIREQGRK